jgi:hypothetical protein
MGLALLDRQNNLGVLSLLMEKAFVQGYITSDDLPDISPFTDPPDPNSFAPYTISSTVHSLS